MKTVLRIPIIAVAVLLLLIGNAAALRFQSEGVVDFNYNDSWDESTLTGTALYSFYIQTDDVAVNRVEIEFESDIFDVSAIDAGDFTVMNPDNWSTALDIVGDYKWSLSSGGDIATTVNDPILITFDYQLLSAERFVDVSGSDANGDWAWDEGQAWGQAYLLSYTMEIPGMGEAAFARSPGSTAPVPEPATMLLLGTGMAGLAAVRRRKAKKA